jgi:hypothetical protein
VSDGHVRHLVALAGAQRANVLKSVEAELFVLRDNEGRTRARLETSPINKQPSLVLVDEHRTAPLLLQLDGKGRPVIFLGGNHQKSAFRIGMGEDGDSPSLGLSSQGRNNLSVVTRSDGSTMLYLADKNGRARLLIQDYNETISLTLRGNGNDSRPRIKIEAKPDGTPDVAVFDQDGKVLFRAPKP